MNEILPTRPLFNCTAEDWSKLRAHFMGSILVDVHLHKLAQSIGASWPIKDKEETPARYLEYSFEELPEAPGLKGQPARLQTLLDVLKETAAFDDPFQDMVQTRPAATKSNEGSVQLLRRVSVSAAFPVEFTALSEETRALCEAEGAKTIGDAVALLQGMAQNLIVAGEVRQLLNSLAHADLKSLSAFLPVRPGTRGLQLPEAICLLIKILPENARAALISAAEGQASIAAESTFETLLAQLPRLLAWFPEETENLRELATQKEALERFFVVAGHPETEQTAVALILRHFAPAAPVSEPEPEITSFFGRLSRLFRAAR